MKKLYLIQMTTALLGMAMAGATLAQAPEPEDFPAARTLPATCDEVEWNNELQQNHPGLIDACQEVVQVEGEDWARFAARFERIEPNGDVIFSVRDQSDRSIEEVALDPAPGQVAYIDDRETPFSQLSPTDDLSLYVPEGQFGFALQAGAPENEMGQILDSEDATPSNNLAQGANSNTPQSAVGQDDDERPAVLPATAGPLPWLALVGFLSLLGGLGLTLRRWYQTHA